MNFSFKVKGKSDTPDLPKTELELCRFIGEMRQAAMNHGLELEIPVEIHIPFDKPFFVDGIVCLISGGPDVG